MRGTAAICTLGTALLSVLPAINAIELVARDSPSVVGLVIERKHVTNPIQRDQLRKRRSKIVEQLLDNEETLYFCNITLGTPAQHVRMHIDTGSSDLWCNSPNSDLCTQSGDPCAEGGTYDPKASSTYQFTNSLFNISYLDGSGASGDYVTDTLSIGGVSLNDFQFGVGLDSTSQEGVLGIGYPANAVQPARYGQAPYPNLPFALVDQGHIKSPAYSLWLNDLDASTGSILFGGVNAAKFHGTLQSLPILRRGGQYIDLVIALTGLSISGNGVDQELSTGSMPVLLDSGSSLCYLPDQLVSAIYRFVQAIYDPSSGAAFIPCRFKYADVTLNFRFSPTLTTAVPMNELILDIGTAVGIDRPSFSNGEPACLFGIAPSGGGTSILGDTFLRSAYVVYDLGNNQISLAQTNFNSTGNNVLEIGTGPGAVPSVTGVSSGAPPRTTATTTSSKAWARPTARPDVKIGALAGLVGVGAGVVFGVV
ncbi:hypothetical protein RJZ56_001873 [Blastomyces dermatitidis]|uniref:Aspartic-type endopeptidase n=3 Tax=Blastomyces TaxID=229219 RepID=A0ABP2ET76_AJEDR|nr:aspartic-type endopeptidase [Blastomyces gilchristii SLH14081]XP_045273561.1 aspartic-type endopeptidase [Blastomyces dermatitidis ER-3]EGE82923.1 aspartic-type endopeptidase [Blastomyces dermatitidis ATCC 18188]EQL32309.1 hypothetical protein BDFG_05537 [Blastomyces dermatitidis ATCC 26199]EEQ85907.1 aspartic-type endopeptidase [Blastomyces dermatitidis ER-3]OAT14330.1 aspartic-type endopeptidase [Blastomyces gilchristii SLH14081]